MHAKLKACLLESYYAIAGMRKIEGMCSKQQNDVLPTLNWQSGCSSEEPTAQQVYTMVQHDCRMEKDQHPLQLHCSALNTIRVLQTSQRPVSPTYLASRVRYYEAGCRTQQMPFSFEAFSWCSAASNENQSQARRGS